MQPVTYQQLLAQHYEESARDILVNHQDYDETPIDPKETSAGMPLENPEDFNTFAGSRGDETLLVKTKKFEDVGKGSVRYSKDVATNIFAIDSRFRAYAFPGIPSLPAGTTVTDSSYVNPILSTATSLSSNFIFRIQKLTRNVFSAKLTSFELPNTFYNIQDIRNNDYISIGIGKCNSSMPYAKVKLLTIDTSIISSSCSNYTQGDNNRPNGFYYSNTSVIQALNASLAITPFPPALITNIVWHKNQGVPSGYVTITAGFASGLSNGCKIVISGIQQVFNSTPQLVPALNGEFTIQTFNFTGLSCTFQIPLSSNPFKPGYFFYPSSACLATPITQIKYLSQDLSVSSSNGYFQINNSSSQNTYSVNFTPNLQDANTLHPTSIYSPLGNLLGFNSYTYDINPVSATPVLPSSFECGQISACQCYGTLTSEDQINMNADPYIYLAIADWANVEHATVNDTFFTAFARIPIQLNKGEIVYDNLTNSTVTKIYYFHQPTNFQQFEVKLLDMTGNLLLMPNTNWSMVLELEEVISQALYEKLREL